MTVTPLDLESELVQRARKGDREALDSLVRRYYPGLRLFVARMVGSQEAEDVAQDVFLRVSRGLETYRGEFRFSTWLFQIAINRSRDLLRRRRPAPPTLPEPSSEPLIHRSVDRDRLLSAVRRLPPELGEPLLLANHQGLSHREIGEILGLSTAAIKMRIHRAIRQLRALLAEEKP